MSIFYDVNGSQIGGTNKYARIWFKEPEPAGIATGKINPLKDFKSFSKKIILLVTVVVFVIISGCTKKTVPQSETDEIVIDFSGVKE